VTIVECSELGRFEGLRTRSVILTRLASTLQPCASAKSSITASRIAATPAGSCERIAAPNASPAARRWAVERIHQETDRA